MEAIPKSKTRWAAARMTAHEAEITALLLKR